MKTASKIVKTENLNFVYTTPETGAELKRKVNTECLDVYYYEKKQPFKVIRVHSHTTIRGIKCAVIELKNSGRFVLTNINQIRIRTKK